MKQQIGVFLVLVLAQMTFGQEPESNALPWWPTQSGSADNSINVKTIQQNLEEDVTQQDTFANQGKRLNLSYSAHHTLNSLCTIILYSPQIVLHGIMLYIKIA